MVTRLQFCMGILLLACMNNYSLNPVEDKKLSIIMLIVMFCLITIVEGRRK